MKVDFFIVGAPKAGTTSLYHYLSEHPQVEMSSQKEPDYFSDEAIQEGGMYYGKNRINTLKKYEALFMQKEGVLYGEGSVSYLFYENVATDIKKYNPDAKIIIMLRNPIERAFSHYLMDYRLGLLSDSFEDVINKKSKHRNAYLFYQQYISVGNYCQQLKRYFEEFGKENILLIDYEDFKNDVGKAVYLVYSFLDISTEFSANINKKHNAFTMPKNKLIRFVYSFVFLRNILVVIFSKQLIKKIRSFLFKNDDKPVMLSSTRDQLKKLFKSDIENLGLLIDKDYTKWIK
jgi:hypothetical protein